MADLTPDRLQELRRIAEAATPGPWAVNPFKATVDEMPSMLPICGLLWPTEERTEEQTFANANYIAEFNPTTALAILGEIERLRRERDAALDVLGREDIGDGAKVEGVRLIMKGGDRGWPTRWPTRESERARLVGEVG